jgi:TolA-binding protein
MMNRLIALIPLLIILLAIPARSQKTTVFSEANAAYKRGEEFFLKGVYGYAMDEYRRALDLLLPVNQPEWELLRMRAELGKAKSAVRLDLPDGEKMILAFIRKYQPDPLASQALLEVANYFYNAGKFDKAVGFYKQINVRELSPTQRSEVYFKIGYSYFVSKDFAKAEANFKEVKDLQTLYFYPSNYYYGLCRFFNGDYSEAIKSFRLVERSQDYKLYVPYYITQIYFAQRDFDEVIRYAEPKLKDQSLRNLKEMNQLVGQAYFEKANYPKALPYLEAYAETSGRMTEEEFYQLGFTQYQVGKYQNAAQNFEQLSGVNSPLGQVALYYMGDCKLRLNDKQAGRNAFAAASRMAYDTQLQENALINYGKLSYELKFDNEALTALQEIRSNSKYYAEAQELMSFIFVNTKNYEQAISALESMPNRTPQLREAYQKVLYLRGLQLLKDGKTNEAKQRLEKSLSAGLSSNYKALALYWLGDIYHREKDYNRSIDYINQYMALAKTQSYLPDEASIFTASYLQGYNYLKKNNFNTAQTYFLDAVNGIKRNRSFILNKDVKDEILGDATLRAGDCLFKRNQYNEAIKLYDEAVNAKYPGFEYALFQKAIIEGLRSNNTEKILALESLVERYPRSPYADDALFHLGITYQEINKSELAIEALKKMVGSYKNSELINTALLRLGLIAYNAGNKQGAIDYYKQIFAYNPEKEEADAALAALREIYIKDIGDSEAYASFLETIPGYKVDNIGRDTLAFDAAETAYEGGNYERAINAYTDYIRKYPNGTNILPAYYHRGDSYMVLEQWSNALKDFEIVVGKGQSRHYHDALKKAAAIAYHNEKDFRKAYDYYNRFELIAATPQDKFEAQLGSMRSAYRLGDITAVQTAARKVSSNPNASQEQVATANFYLGKIAYDRKELSPALESFLLVIKNSDNEQTAEARYLVAHIYYQQRNLDKAKDQCLKNNNESASYPYWVGKSLLLLSDVFAEQNDLFSARTVLEALIENYSNKTDEIIPTARQKLQLINQQSAGKNRLAKPEDTKFMDDGIKN